MDFFPTQQDSFVDVLNAVGDTFEVGVEVTCEKNGQIMTCAILKSQKKWLIFWGVVSNILGKIPILTNIFRWVETTN